MLLQFYKAKTKQNKKLTTIDGDADEKSLKASNTCSLFFVVLKSFDDVPSLFFTPSIRKPKVAVDEIVSLQTIYLKNKFKK